MKMLGSTVARTWLTICLTTVCAAAGTTPQKEPQGPDIEKLCANLRQPGADGSVARMTAVERLLAMADPAAHAALSEELARTEDPDKLRLAILQGLNRHLLQTDASQFGGAGTAVRRQIFCYYLGTLAEWWREGGKDVGADLREAARDALEEVPVRELEAAARALLEKDNVEPPALFGCLADLQSLYLGQVLADYVGHDDPRTRGAARAALRMLTFRQQEFTTREEFVQWQEQHTTLTYTDLAERAAREGSQRVDQVRRQLELERVARTRDVVKAYTDAGPGINWEAISRHTLVTDGTLVDAALATLRDELTERIPAAASPPRQLFCRRLLELWQQTPVEMVTRRSLLLEVAAYTARLEESEIVSELQTALLAQLQRPVVEEQLAALRGLRRFPSAANRAVLVQYAQSVVELGVDASNRIETALATLSSRSAPRWFAPGSDDADKAAWIALIRSIWQRPALGPLRDRALALALSPASVGPGGDEVRVPEIFDLLLEFAQDPQQDSSFRATCVIRLTSWTYQAGAKKRQAALYTLLADNDAEVRRHAAQSLGKLAKIDPAGTIVALRDRLEVETAAVLPALVDTLVACGTEPEMPEKAIGAINHVLGQLQRDGVIPPEHEFREEPLLGALFQIASSENASNGPWLGACSTLLAFEKRNLLRLLLNRQHVARNMAQDVESADQNTANRAQIAMQLLIKTALMKPADQAWDSSPELKDEANAVLIAFRALNLERVPPAARLEAPAHRLLHLEVALVGSRFRDVVDLAERWLAATEPATAPNGGPRVAFTDEQKDYVRLLAAEAQLGLNRPDAAAALLAAREPRRPLDARALAVFDKVARALAESKPAVALDLFDRARRASQPEDPAFRQRLIDWATTRIGLDPKTRPAVWAEIEPHAALFRAEDCPAELRRKFEGLRGNS